MTKAPSTLLNLLWLLLPVAALGTFGRSGEQQRMVQAIDEGSVLAWARHITGQDPNDLTSFDQFESVAVIPGSSNRANGDMRTDDEIWVVVKRTINGQTVRTIEQFQPLDWGPDPNYCWFVDCAGEYEVVGSTPGTPAVPATYTLTYVSEGGWIYGVPLRDTTLATLDNGGVPCNVGGGVVGLPFAGHPFSAGQVVNISGSGNYNGQFTLQAGTTANELQILDVYAAETFDGTETVVRAISESIAGIGHMARDSSGNFYYAHVYDAASGSCVTRVSPDGTETSDFLTWPSLGQTTGTSAITLALSSDDAYLYVLLDNPDYVVKFDLATGTSDWATAVAGVGYDMDIDADGNAYAQGSRSGYVQKILKKFNASTGAATILTGTGGVNNINVVGSGLDVHVDDTLGIVIAAGQMYTSTVQGPAVIGLMYNLAVRTLDDSAGDTMLVGGTYVNEATTLTDALGTGFIDSDGEYIYALIIKSTPESIVYKLQWDGATLSEVTHWSGPTYGCGLLVDIYGNVVVVNQSNIVAQTTLFYFYDTDGNLLASLPNFNQAMLGTWAALAGGVYTQGDFAFDGDLGTPAVPATPGYTYVATELGGEHVCVYADGVARGTFVMDGNDIADFNEADYSVTIAGLNYFSIFETTPLQGALTMDRPTALRDVTVNFQDSMGAHVGADMAHSSDWKFHPKARLTGSARDPNDGTVALPYSGARFAAGDEVYIYGSAYYGGLQTLAADTNAVELRVSASYNAESFDGTEWVVSNTPPGLFSGYKGPAPFLRGTQRRPSVYFWIWDPVPMTIRSVSADMEVTVE